MDRTLYIQSLKDIRSKIDRLYEVVSRSTYQYKYSVTANIVRFVNGQLIKNKHTYHIDNSNRVLNSDDIVNLIKSKGNFDISEIDTFCEILEQPINIKEVVTNSGKQLTKVDYKEINNISKYVLPKLQNSLKKEKERIKSLQNQYDNDSDLSAQDMPVSKNGNVGTSSVATAKLGVEYLGLGTITMMIGGAVGLYNNPEMFKSMGKVATKSVIYAKKNLDPDNVLHSIYRTFVNLFKRIYTFIKNNIFFCACFVLGLLLIGVGIKYLFFTE